MTYDTYERSSADDKFEEFDADDIMVAWLDILGTRGLGHSSMVRRLDDLLQIAGQASSLGPLVGSTLVGTPQWLFQYAVVGDALVMTQKYDPEVTHACQFGLMKGVLKVSKALFENGIPHRAAVTVGKVRCKIDNRAAIITGEAVLRAYFLESRIKTLGVYMDKSCDDFAGWYRQYMHSNPKGKKEIYFAPLGSRRIFVHNPSLVPIKASAIVVGRLEQHKAKRDYCSKFAKAKKVVRTSLLLRACGLDKPL